MPRIKEYLINGNGIFAFPRHECLHEYRFRMAEFLLLYGDSQLLEI